MVLRAVAAVCLVALAGTGCAGDGETATRSDTSGAVDQASFKDTIASALKLEGFEAEPGVGLEVRVYERPEFIDLDLEEPLARFRADPGSEAAIKAELVAEAADRLAEGISGESLAEISSNLFPLLKAPFELRTFEAEPVRTEFAGQLSVVYAVDRVDSFVLVGPEDLERWEMTPEALHELALGNLLRLTETEEPLSCEPTGDAKLCGWASGDGYDATRMIVPELRLQIVAEYGEEAVYAVPMENVYVALPLSVFQGQNEDLFRLKVERDFQTSDNPLSPDVFIERRGRLVVAE